MSGHALLGALILAGAALWALSLWMRPYGKCRALGCRGGRIAGSADDAWGRCPKCHGQPVPRFGAATVAKLIGKKYGRRFW